LNLKSIGLESSEYHDGAGFGAIRGYQALVFLGQ